ncbi:OPT oligopeptide transporter protein-domain-containing protein [Thamnocephalis sphaerospora]|uniref:OPT oligopeptide transporter protein-domain-containing protein n=1 Tax=Thamnocephalis sphaerospora TaxID=78915 RepID=A0A4V1IXA8_9FUNG|nr:OPT oligopeptide transporter protein-domain-containing protein [Thamnocephalis sphaerospora]|eukprot:RKP10409.1 OPT oligopeptide transporter protein-domain-containing protein [Thamnocephalis sphaerospora]
MVFKRKPPGRTRSVYATSFASTLAGDNEPYGADRTHPSVVDSAGDPLDDEDSPFEIVRATVSNKDDGTLPTLTFRFWLLSILFTAILSFANQVLAFRDYSILISPIVVQLVSFPLGKGLARVLPDWHVHLGTFSFRLNPGPFNMKEHALIIACANSASAVAYAVDIIVVRRIFYQVDRGFLGGLLLVLTTQCLGYGLAGICRRFLIRPAAMIWPANLVSVALYRTLHEEADLEALETDAGGSGARATTRMRFFMIATLGSFAYYFLPGYLASFLGAISILCLIHPHSLLLNQLGSGRHGLGILSFSLDWNNVISFLGSPMVTPFWASLNLFVGFVIVCWILLPIGYYSNWWNAKQFPIIGADVYDINGKSYPVLSVLNKTTWSLDETLYKQYGEGYMSFYFAISYGAGFATLGAVVVHTMLYHGREIMARLRDVRTGAEDIHARLMDRYQEVPNWWYVTVLMLNTGLAILTCHLYDLDLPWWGLLLAVLMAAVFIVPIGIITAIANQTPGLNIITEFIIGYLLPGRPIANMTFKTYGYISVVQGISFLGDLKLGHYMKIPPRHMFLAQMIGTIIAGVINLATAYLMMNIVPNLCAPDGNVAATRWSCSNTRTFYSASIIWGVIGPKRLFSTTESLYSPILWAFLIGALLPIPCWLLARRFPGSWLVYVHAPILLSATSLMPPARPAMYNTWIIVGFVFQFVIYRYRHHWWSRFNYVLSAALETGTALGALVVFFAFQLRRVHLDWWGNNDLCRADLDHSNTS